MESNLRAETMAEYYETVQWRKMLATALPDGPMLGPILPVSERAVDEDEVLKTIRRLKSGKAAGRDGMPDFGQADMGSQSARLRYPDGGSHGGGRGDGNQ